MTRRRDVRPHTRAVTLEVRLPPFKDFAAGLTAAAALTAVLLIPIYFDPGTERVFEPDKLSLAAILAALGVIGVVGRWDGRRPPGGPAVVAVGVALLAVAWGTAVSVSPEVSLWGSYRRAQGLLAMAVYVGIFLSSRTALSNRSLGILWRKNLLLGAVPVAGYAVLQRLGQDPIQWDASGLAETARAFSSLGNPIFLGAYAAMLMPVALSDVAARRQSGWRTWSALGVVALLATALVASASRGPLVGLAIGLAVAVLVLMAAASLRRLALASVAAAVVVLAAGATLAARAVSGAEGLAGAIAASRTAEERLLLWDALARLTSEHFGNAARGFGPDLLAPVISPYLTPALVALTPTQIYDRAHNVAWEWWLGAGVVGLVALALLHAAAFHLAAISLARAKQSRLTPGRFALTAATAVGSGLLGVVGAYLVDRPGLAGPGFASGLLVGLCAWLAMRRFPDEVSSDVVAEAANGDAASKSGRAGGAGKREPSRSDRFGLARIGRLTPRAWLVAGALGAVAAHLGEGLFGLPNVTGLTLFFAILGWLSSDPVQADTGASRAQRDSLTTGEAAADGAIEGLAMAAVVAAPIVAPGATPTASIWLLLPLMWLYADALASPQESEASPARQAAKTSGPDGVASAWARPLGRLAILLVYGLGIPLQTSTPAARPLMFIAVALLALVIAAFGLAFGRQRAREPLQTASPPTTRPARALTGVTAAVLLLVIWRAAVAPLVADSHIRAALAAASTGDVAAYQHVAEARAWWPEQPSYGTYVAAAYRDMLLDADRSAEEREAAYGEGVAALQAALAAVPSADTLGKLGDLHVDRGDLASGSQVTIAWHAGEAAYRAGLELQPVSPRLEASLGAVLERLERWDEAVVAYERALTVEPANVRARAGHTRSLLALGEVEAALESMDEGLDYDTVGVRDALNTGERTPIEPAAVIASQALFLAATGQVDRTASRLEAHSRAIEAGGAATPADDTAVAESIGAIAAARERD